MQKAAIATTLLSSLLIACGDGVVISDTNQLDVNDPTVGTQTPFTPVNDASTSDAPVNDTPANDNAVNDAPTNTPVTQGGDIRFYGYLGFFEYSARNEVIASGSFTQLANTTTAASFTNNLNVSEDSCTIPDFNAVSTDTTFDDSTSVSAGEALVTTSVNGTFTQLMRQEANGSFFYSPENFAPIAGDIPDGLAVDIPGDVFPAFANVNAPTVNTLQLTSPTVGEAVTANTNFSWTADGNQNTSINIMATAFVDGQSTVVSCRVVDDGNFTFPAAIQAQLGDDFTSIFASVSRIATSVQQNGDAILLFNVASEAL